MCWCAQMLLRSKAMGVGYLAGLVMNTQDSSNDKYIIGGFRRFESPPVLLLSVVAAVALQPLNLFLETLLRDDRFFLQAATLRDRLLQGRERISALPSAFWRRLCQAGGLESAHTAWEVRSWCLLCMHKGHLYLDANAYAQLRRFFVDKVYWC